MTDIPFYGTGAPNPGGVDPCWRSENIIGAFTTFADVTARNLIPATMLRQGEFCYLESTGVFYKWSGAAWVVYTFGGSSTASGGGDGFRFTYSTTTTDADPGAGTLRLNNATIASVTTLYVDLAEYGATDVTAWLDSLDDGGGSPLGRIRLQSISDPTKWAVFNLTAWTTAVGYRKLTVAHVASPPAVAFTTTAGDTFLSFDSAGSGGGALADNAVTMAKLADLAGLSVIGRSANTSGDPAAITATTDQVLRESGGALGFGTIASGGIAANAVTLAKMATQAALTVLANATNATAVPTAIAAASDGLVFCRSGTTLVFSTVQTAGIANDAVTYAKIQNVSATDRLLGRDTAAAGDIEELTVSGGIEFTGSAGIQVSSQLPARGGENVVIDLYPSTQQQGTLATASSVNFDIAVPAGKRARITADIWVDNGAGGACLYAKELRIRAHITGGVAVKVSDVTSDAPLEGQGFTFVAAANSTNIRFTLSNTSGSTRSYNIAAGSWSMDTP